MFQRKNRASGIPAGKMALLAEKGLNAVHLSRAEKDYLANGGMNELFAIKKGIKNPIPPLEQQFIDKVMTTYFSVPAAKTSVSPLIAIAVRLTKTTVKIIAQSFDWQLDSPAFAQRGPESGAVSFCKEAGKLTIHIEINKSGDRRANVNVRLTDKSKRECSFFDAALFQQDQCIESVHVATNPVASFLNISSGDYMLKVADKKGDITSVNIRLEE